MNALHTCTKEREIESIRDDVSKIEEDISGNGKPGIKAELIKIKEGQEHMNGLLGLLNTSVSALVRFQVEVTTEKAMKEKIKLNTTNVVNIIIAAVVGACGIIAALIIG